MPFTSLLVVVYISPNEGLGNAKVWNKSTLNEKTILNLVYNRYHASSVISRNNTSGIIAQKRHVSTTPT